jgi:hypothetical protein
MMLQEPGSGGRRFGRVNRNANSQASFCARFVDSAPRPYRLKASNASF